MLIQEAKSCRLNHENDTSNAQRKNSKMSQRERRWRIWAWVYL